MRYEELSDEELVKLTNLCLLQFKLTRFGYPHDLIQEAMRRRRR